MDSKCLPEELGLLATLVLFSVLPLNYSAALHRGPTVCGEHSSFLCASLACFFLPPLSSGPALALDPPFHRIYNKEPASLQDQASMGFWSLRGVLTSLSELVVCLLSRETLFWRRKVCPGS